MQMSGSGLVAPCGMLFNEKYKDFHIGNINENRFKDIFNSDRYAAVMKKISEEPLDTNKDCAKLCLQHKANEFLWELKNYNRHLDNGTNESADKPQHINFV
jgi:hypothetical protein